MNDFDKLPQKTPTVSYKYYEKLPRKKNERKRLNAYTCKDCEKYYSTVSEERIQISSRHRGNKRPSTPEHFWDLDFPDDIEIPTETYTFKPLEENKYYTQAKQ
ncbi:uncharacterized protein NPIL_60491 [Nephila pilipes]|uniref:DNA endonuclease activator Ctp1 C-terminal domain-containing protein n=1 Tax=Nephila pilipes TaxID=299642 RepID=A0A8X6MNA4_NEPPI|nr:uncharacterized protein NPIL_60491 [Nephila pilipes]